MSRMSSETPTASTPPPSDSTSAAGSAPRNLTPFGGAPREKTPFPLIPWVAAGSAVLLLVLALLFAGHAKPAVPEHTREQDDYASSLSFFDLQMSESTSLSGGKSTFIDGQVKNTGSATVRGATLQVAFANDEALPAQVVTLPLAIIRTREPYVDTQPLSEAPLAPGATREFRLIFEGIGANWNQQLPQVRVAKVFTECNPCR